MIRALGEGLSRWSRRWVPDPFVLALLLTFGTLALAVAVTGEGPLEVVGQWGGRLARGEVLPGERGFWKLLRFGMQMVLILVTGHALASAPVVGRAIRRVAGLPATARGAVGLTALVAMAAGLVNWGLGLIVGALMAREVGRAARGRGLRVHYPLLGAAGYTGLMVWHGGLSGSAPLKVTVASEVKSLLGDVGLDPVPLTHTIFSPMNLALTAALLVVVPVLLGAMLPKDEDVVEFEPADRDVVGGAGSPPEDDGREGRDLTPAERLERSRLLAWLAAGLGLAYLWLYLARVGLGRLDLNTMNLAFLAVGLIAHGSPKAYAGAVAEGVRGASGIILQFPFYAGIMGLMALSGLAETFVHGVIDVAGPHSFGPLTFASAGAVNLFVPSGGGQWAVQGPVVVQAAHALGVAPGKAIMAFAYGDEWTNMLQPFWALPLLAVTGLRASQLIGYTAALMLLVAPLYLGALLLF